MPATILVGGFFGDEGKGKIIAYLAKHDKPSVVARGGVGPNAGHTVEVEGKKYGLRMVPSGFVYESARLLVGAGVLVDPEVFKREVSSFGLKGRIGVDWRCGIIEKKHIEEDKSDAYLKGKIGSTGSGCGPANAARASRKAKQAKDEKELAEFLCDVPLEVNEALDQGKGVLVEGTQGFGISLLYGTYPFVTSKDTTASQMATDVGIGPTRVDEVIVVFKSFPTRVGEGPFETQMKEEKANALHIVEYGTVTGRKRRIGEWDAKMAAYSAMINGATMVALSGVDRLDPACRGVREYKELSKEVKDFVAKVEHDTRVQVKLISTGPELSEIVDLREEQKEK
uniref:Adenylosuccinate synthetase n=1 Tax=Candidatus Methanophagaceae archaeon ANME-1 ERB6 TaxID=2759912 RepID=A0A7G9YYM2_9EURY|nr:adenylosuccinate synthetase [Methanosarcinales archaeon ANME-1 ERB6]